MAAGDYLRLQARLQPRRLAALELTTGRRWDYATFEQDVGRYAAALQAQGITVGGRVAVLAKNRVSLVLLHLACARLGAMLVPLNWRLAAAELEFLLTDAAPDMILGDALLGAAGIAGTQLDDFEAAAAATAPLDVAVPPGDLPSLILYTSGTSGRPKGVLLSEDNIWQTGRNFSLLAKITHASAVLCDTPMFHVIGLITNIRPALMNGGAFVVSEGFTPGLTLARLADPALAITHYFCVPQMLAMLRADPGFDPDKLRRLTAIFSGGAPHAADAIRAWAADGIPVADGFGMSEAGTISCMPADLDLIDARAGAAGILPPGVAVRIIDEDGQDCPPGVSGEIIVKGANVTTGYWRRPADSAAAFTADGWLRSGDIGRLDADGYLWLIDRKKDMFISGGENIYPAEIEAVLATHPDISECAVIGVADERWGEVGHLALVARLPAAFDQAALLAYMETRLARYKIPKHVSVLAALPRNGAGKLAKAVLREMLVGK